MSISVTPDSSDTGAMCTARVQYDFEAQPEPNDVHIDAKHNDGTWHAVTSYDHIPAGLNPRDGFDIRFSGGNPNVGGPGKRHFRVRWTLDDKPLHSPDETFFPVKLGIPSPLTWWERIKRWWNSIDWHEIMKGVIAALKALSKKKKH